MRRVKSAGPALVRQMATTSAAAIPPYRGGEALWGTRASEPPGPAALPKQPASTRPPRPPPHLFRPFTVRGLTLKNRIVVSPMCMYSSTDGMLSDWHLVHLGSFAKGGAGLVVFEASAVVPEGRITQYDAGIWKDEQIGPMSRIVDFIHQHKSAACLQIAHAGRKAREVRRTLKAAGRPWALRRDDMRQPKEMTKQEIQDTIRAFVDATVRADKAGFDAVEVHGAHGYLISSFNSPLSNHRTDDYGGSFEGRTKLCREIVKEVRNAWPREKPLFVRLSCTDWVEGGWDLPQTVRLCRDLKELCADVIDCSSGGQSPSQKIAVGPSYQVPLADAVRREVTIPTCAVGEISQAAQAEEILVNQRADLVAIGRQFLRDPFWPLHAARDLGADLHWAVQYVAPFYLFLFIYLVSLSFVTFY
ncbi:NADH:flavin oxidoreductase/NADH oxidase [Acanthamoeba castellanii str. Neff]|uniref:NADH:flavin oxidoreductase/NADH oxidase n=1 Tax=Acanthamoeba castellanii (strain ATCC 30010 / Neff) TaxID=1257118 RepID=L8GEI7_ACACF|nr:NADH:flavin oxidoreductase/NADH oxidase [Acanthamoeba castellanii str. Neff]ELR11442.1 NADH:flavin oxidoreductase/NADH oxidase [Acanthamoeba castellanii str. Neff]